MNLSCISFPSSSEGSFRSLYEGHGGQRYLFIGLLWRINEIIRMCVRHIALYLAHSRSFIRLLASSSSSLSSPPHHYHHYHCIWGRDCAFFPDRVLLYHIPCLNPNKRLWSLYSFFAHWPLANVPFCRKTKWQAFEESFPSLMCFQVSATVKKCSWVLAQPRKW